jgi:hypothetical protein
MYGVVKFKRTFKRESKDTEPPYWKGVWLDFKRTRVQFLLRWRGPESLPRAKFQVASLVCGIPHSAHNATTADGVQ